MEDEEDYEKDDNLSFNKLSKFKDHDNEDNF